MHLEKEAKFMEKLKARIERSDEDVTLILDVRGENLQILLTQDKPSDVKETFNLMLVKLKEGEFNFELQDEHEDLYHHMCEEYIKQLNSELSSVHREMTRYALLENQPEEEEPEE